MIYTVRARDTHNNMTIMGEYAHDEEDLAIEHEEQLTNHYPMHHIWIDREVL